MQSILEYFFNRQLFSFIKATKIFFLSLLFFFCSCSKKVISKQSLMDLVLKADPEAQLILPESLGKGPLCRKEGKPVYPEGCQSVFEVLIFGIKIHFVEFDSEKNARQGAQYTMSPYLGNWVFDTLDGGKNIQKELETKLGAKSL